MGMDVYNISGLKFVPVNKNDLGDICISAMRYALYRHTYVVDSTIDFVMKNADNIFNERVYKVMFRDVSERIQHWDENEPNSGAFQMDLECIKSFRDWMVKYGEEQGYRKRYDGSADIL